MREHTMRSAEVEATDSCEGDPAATTYHEPQTRTSRTSHSAKPVRDVAGNPKDDADANCRIDGPVAVRPQPSPPLHRAPRQTVCGEHGHERDGVTTTTTPHLASPPSPPLSPGEDANDEEGPDEESMTVSAPEETPEGEDDEDEEEEGYFDEEGNYFYYDEEDVGYYDKEGIFHYYDDYEEEQEEDEDEDDEEDDGVGVYEFSSSPSYMEEEEEDSRGPAMHLRRSPRTGVHGRLQEKACVRDNAAPLSSASSRHDTVGGAAARRVLRGGDGEKDTGGHAIALGRAGESTAQTIPKAPLLRASQFDSDEDDVYRDTPPRRLMLTHSPPSL